MDILERIQGKYDELSRVQKRIAEYILQHPVEACFLSLKEFTEAVAATEVTIVNFTRKIGLKSFLELKKELQAHIQRCMSPDDKIKRAVVTLKSEDNFLDKLVENERQILEQTYSGLELGVVQRAVSLIRQARRIYVTGHGVSHPVVCYLEQRLRYVGIEVAVLDPLDESKMAIQLHTAAADDLVILVTFPDYSQRVLRLADYLKREGIPILVLTDKQTSPASSYARVVLSCSTNDTVFNNSLTAPMSVVNLLTSFYALEEKERLLEHRNRIEKIEGRLRENK